MKADDKYSGKSVLVTGAAGYIGTALCKRLTELNAIVVGQSRKKRNANSIVSNWLKGDLSDPAITDTIIRDLKPDVVFHLASYVTGNDDLSIVQKTYHSNLTSTVNLLTSVTKYEVQRIVLSGSLEEPAHHERFDYAPSTPYAASKCSASMYAKMFFSVYNTPVTIARIFMVYGPGNQKKERLLPHVIRALITGEIPVVYSGDRRIDWIYIEDLINGLIKTSLSDKVLGEKVDLGSGRQITVKDICKKTESLIGASGKIRFEDEALRQNERECTANTAETFEKIGWKPQTSLNDGLQQMIDWHRENV